MKTVGLSDVRLERNLSQRDVAKLVGCSHTAVQKWEANGDAPSLSFLPKVVEALQLSPAVAADLKQRAVEHQLAKGAA